MKELRSTEILDKEIEDDARKRAEKILKNADEEAKKIIAGVADRVQTTLEERRVGLDTEYSRFVRDKEAVLPLDQIRYLAAFEEKAIIRALDAYLQALSPEKKEAVVAKQLAAYRILLEGQGVTVECFGMTEKAAAKLVEKNCGAKVTACMILDGKNADKTLAMLLPLAREGITVQCGVVIETVDKGLRCRATLNDKVDSIMETYTYELAETLFGGRLPV
jgi:V/A-type H+-transporting ATPase subunit E